MAVKDPDLAHIARIEADGDGLADIGGERRVQELQPLEVEDVAMHDAGLGDYDERRIQRLQAIGHSREPPVAPPSVDRRRANRAMHAGVVGRHHECADGRVQFGERQPWRRRELAIDKIAGQLWQQLRLDRAEQPLDLPATLWPGDGRVDQLEAEIGRGLFEVEAGEVGAVVAGRNGVSHSWYEKSIIEGAITVTLFAMPTTLIGYARCSTEKQDLAA